MTQHSYQKIIRARYNYLKKCTFPIYSSRALEAVLAMPHPQRELAFIAWATQSEKSPSVEPSLDRLPTAA